MNTTINGREFSAAEMTEIKKLRVNPAMGHDPVSIISVLTSTLLHLEAKGALASISSIVAEIRHNREQSTMVQHDDVVSFNPSLVVTGTNPRTFPVYFEQKQVKGATYTPPAPETKEVQVVEPVKAKGLAKKADLKKAA